MSSEGGVAWAAVWADVARLLGSHRAAGRGHLLTEDTLRMSTVLALETAGIAPEHVAIEVFDPALHGGKLDVVVEGIAGRTVIELKSQGPRGLGYRRTP